MTETLGGKKTVNKLASNESEKRASGSLERMVRCGQCKWRNSDGYCTCPKLYESGMPPDGEPEMAPDHLVYSYYEGGGFWVGKNFGCVHGVKAPNDQAQRRLPENL